MGSCHCGALLGYANGYLWAFYVARCMHYIRTMHYVNVDPATYHNLLHSLGRAFKASEYNRAAGSARGSDTGSVAVHSRAMRAIRTAGRRGL